MARTKVGTTLQVTGVLLLLLGLVLVVAPGPGVLVLLAGALLVVVGAVFA